VPINDIVECKIICLANNQIGEFVLHYRISAVGAPEPTVTDIAGQVQDTFKDDVIAIISQKATYAGATAQRIWPTRSVRGDYFVPITGTGSTSLLPTQTSGLITKFTTLAGRKNRGRSYIPFPGESDSDDNGAFPNTAYKTKLDNIAALIGQQIITAVGGGSVTMDPVIYHRSTQTSIALAGAQKRNQWATQRRRGAYGAANIFP